GLHGRFASSRRARPAQRDAMDSRPNMVAARHDHPRIPGRGHHRLCPMAHPTEVGVNAVTCARTVCSWRAAMNGTLGVRGLPTSEVYHLSRRERSPTSKVTTNPTDQPPSHWRALFHD